MIDWPGRLSATVFLSGCPLACPFCHNSQLIAPGERRAEDLDALLGHLRDRRGWIDGVVVSGGEPTADPALSEFLGLLKGEGVRVRLDTNGTAPELLSALIADTLVDCVALDVKAVPERYPEATGGHDVWDSVAACIETLVSSGIDHEFRTTICPGVTEPADLPSIASRLSGGRAYVIQQFRPERTLDLELASATPPAPSTLRDAAEKCSAFLPTTVRGV